MSKQSATRRRFSVALTVIYLLAAANLLAFATIVWLIKPLWPPVDRSLNHMVGWSLPWSVAILAATLLCIGVTAYAVRRAWRAKRRPLVSTLFTVAAAIAADGMWVMLFQGLEKDRMILPLRAIDCAPYVGVVFVLALLTVLLPRLKVWQSSRVRWAVLGIAVLMLALAVYKPWPPRIVAGPWLEIATNDGITVSWMTDRPTLGRVEYGPDLRQVAQTYRYGMSEVSRIHRVTLTKVKPGEAVTYRAVSQVVRAIEPYSIRLGGTVASAPHTFTVPDPDAEEVSFLFISDLHEQLHLLPDLLKTADAKKHAFIVLNGDTLFQGQNEYQVVRFARAISSICAAEIPFVLIRGNHDSAGVFARRLPEYLGFREDPFAVWLRAGPAALLFLDTGDIDSDVEADRRMLGRQISACNAIASSPEWCSASFRILCDHVGIDRSMSKFFSKPGQVGPDLELVGHIHTTALRYGDHPILTASGEAWFDPETFPVYTVHVNRERIAVAKILRNGEQVDQWEFGTRSESGK